MTSGASGWSKGELLLLLLLLESKRPSATPHSPPHFHFVHLHVGLRERARRHAMPRQATWGKWMYERDRAKQRAACLLACLSSFRTIATNHFDTHNRRQGNDG